MTLDSTPDSTTPATQEGGEPAPRKRAPRTRARVTKAAGDPAPTEAPAAEAPATTPAPAADEAPTKPVRRRATRKAATAAEVPAADDVAAVLAAESGADPAPAAPADEAPAAPRRRRATRSTAAATAAAEQAAAPAEPAATPAATTPAAEAPVAAPAAAEPEVAPAPASTTPVRRSRRVTRPAGAGVAAQPAAAQPAAAQPAAAQPEPAPAAPTAEPVIEEPEDEQVAEAVEQAEQTSAAAPDSRLDVLAELGRSTTDAPAKAPRTRGGRGRSKAAQTEQTEQPASTDAARAPEAAPAAAAARPERAPQRSAAPAGEQERPASTRLATTALLFQAPEAPRRRRRAQAPTGTPEVVSASTVVEEAPAAVSEATAPVPEAQAPAAEEQVPARRRGRRGRSRTAEVVEPAEVVEDEPTSVDEDLVEAEQADVARAAEQADADADADERDEADRDEAEGDDSAPRRRRRRGGRGRRSRGGADADGDDAADEGDRPAGDRASDEDADATEDDQDEDADEQGDGEEQGGSSRRRRRRRRSGRGGDDAAAEAPASSRGSRSGSRGGDEVTALRGSTRLEAKRQRRREGRDAGRRRQIITEAEFLARREAVERSMVVRESGGRTQIAVLEDGVLVEHYVSRQAQVSMAGNVYLGRVQNVLPSMEAAFVDVGKGRNAVLYAGEVNWDAAGLDGGQPRRIEQALKSGDPVLVQVTKDPIGHKGARLTSQITLAGRYLVYVPGGGMTGISRKLPEPERARLKKILREVVPDSAGVIVRTAAEGASEDELRADIARLQAQWEAIEKKSKTASAPALLQGEPDLAIRVVRDIFNDDFSSLVVQGDEAWSTISGYIGELAPDLAEKVSRWTGTGDVFAAHRVDEQLAKGMDRKVWLPSGGSLVIDRTEAMTVVDVNTGKFTGAGGTLEETVTRNNLEAAEEIVRQLRLRDIGGIIVIDFIDMVLESNRDLVLRRLVECLGRDRTKHQVAEVTSLGLVQMTRKRVGQGLVEAFSETCEHCHGRGFVVHTEPVEKGGRQDPAPAQPAPEVADAKKARRKRGGAATKEQGAPAATTTVPVLPEAREAVKATLATIAAAAAHAHVHDDEAHEQPHDAPAEATAPATDDAVPVSGKTATETVEVSTVEVVAETGIAAEAVAGAARTHEQPVLDVLAAFGTRTARAPERSGAPVDPQLELTPVDPGLFELPEAGAREGDDES
ncbi:ribonuclease E/G [Cellulomonas sp. NPDC058312]|uniref:Rne/Rng family ribonuclease n=1 Tax=Cellulomonas sp. NPDC058312 TaxID=3346441 RepID=UPI0036EADCE3